MTSPVSRVAVAVEPDLSGFGGKLRSGLERDTTLAHVGSQHGKNYASAAVKSGGGAIKSGMAGVWRTVAAAGAAVGVGKILEESVKGIRDHNRVVAQSNAVIASTKGAAHESVGAVSALSDALERKTTIDGDVIQSGANMLLTFTNVRNGVGKNNDIFNQSTKTLLDMSTALGTDAPTSAIQLGKALNDPIRGMSALSRVGVTFDAGQRKQIKTMQEHGNIAGAQKVILAELNKEFGGSAAKMAAAQGAQGRLTVAWRQAQDTIGTALLPVVDELQGALADRLPGAAAKAAHWIGEADKQVKSFSAGLKGRGPISGYSGALNTLGLGLRAAKLAFADGEVTSRGFVGGMERGGVQARKFSDWLHNVDWKSFRQGASQVGDQLKRIDFGRIGNSLKNIHTGQVGAGFTVMGAGLKFVADHIGLVVKALPFLVAGFALYKASQAAANVTALASLPIRAAQVVANILLARAVKSLAAAQREQTGAGIASEAVGLASTGIQNAATASMVRGRVATLASAAASKIARGASIAFSVAQRAVGVAMTFALGPVGLIIIGVAAVAAGLIYAYKHSETFRKIVNGAFSGVGKAATALWQYAIRPAFKFIADAWLNTVGMIVNGAAKAFGWAPKIGGPLRKAAAEFNAFRDRVNRALDGTTKPRTVTVSAKLLASQAAAVTIERVGPAGGRGRMATGGRVLGSGTGTSDDIAARLSNNEHVVTEREVRGAGGHAEVERTRAMWAARGYAAGGRVGSGLQISPQLQGMPQFQKVLDDFGRRVAVAAARLASNGAVNAGLNGAENYAKQIAARGAPYVWGSGGPGGWDCSGWMSTLIHVARGDRNRYARLGATGSMPWSMMAPGPGAFTIGWTTDAGGGIGHTAGTINGYNTESRGGDGVVGGSRSKGANYPYFTHHAHLKGFAGGGRVLPGDPPFDLLDPRGRHYRPDLAGALRGVGRHRDGLSYVPHDDYPAMLHRGERVLTAQANERYAGPGGGAAGRPIVIQVVLDGQVVAEAAASRILAAADTGSRR